tara:strand:- start:1346 stop:1603 length:258 start_codon:yes stop_codon:yes gene_type:complete
MTGSDESSPNGKAFVFNEVKFLNPTFRFAFTLPSMMLAFGDFEQIPGRIHGAVKSSNGYRMATVVDGTDRRIVGTVHLVKWKLWR